MDKRFRLPADPQDREQLKDWLRRREQLAPGVPLSPREYLMVERLRGKKPPYSLT